MIKNPDNGRDLGIAVGIMMIVLLLAGGAFAGSTPDEPTGSYILGSTPQISPVLKYIVVSPSPSTTLTVGQKQNITSRAYDQYDKPMAGVDISWTVSNIGVGNVIPVKARTDVTGGVTSTFTALMKGIAIVNARNASVVSNNIALIVNAIVPGSPNLIINPGFESGKTPWMAYPATSLLFSTVSPGTEGTYSAKLAFSSVPLGTQLYQPNIKTIEPNTRYRLSFAAYSTTGHDVSVKLKKTLTPFTSYGLDSVIDLGTTWKEYSVEFNTTVTTNVTDACLQFYLYPYAQVGDIYYIDDVRLEKVSSTPVAPAITTHPAAQTVAAGQVATFSVTATGSTPLTYQWQKNNVNIAGAVGPMYTTPATILTDSGSTYRVQVTNSAGSAMSNAAMLTVNPTSSTNLIINPGFESGKTPWLVYPTTSITYSTVSPGSEGTYSAKLSFSSVPLGTQLYQPNIKTLEPNTRYRLSFSAYSTSGNDVSVKLKKTLSPYTSYGLDSVIDLGTTWKDYSVEFNTTITSSVTDACLQFYLYPYAKVGDIYYIDDVRLEKVSSTPVAPAIKTHPAAQTVTAGQVATFSVTATGSTPLTYQWQKNNVNIAGAVGPMYTTPATILSDNGSTYRVLVTNSAGSAMSNAAILTVNPASSTNLIINPGFESGKTPWMAYPATSLLFSTVSPGNEGTYSAKLAFSSVPLGTQLYQPNIKTLEPNTRYRLSFAAYSTTGHDVSVKLKKTLSPYTSYGLDSVIDLGTTWKEYSVEFNTTITSSVNDGCLQFYLYPFAVQTDIYYIDNVVLEKIS